MSLSSKARFRAYGAAALALTAVSTACNKDKLLQVTDPDLLNVADYQTPAAANALRYGVISLFNSAFDGGGDAFTVITGNMSDELLSSDTFDTRLTINARKSDEINSDMEGSYRSVLISTLVRERCQPANRLACAANSLTHTTRDR